MNLFLDILFPKKCVGCGKYGTYLCRDCILNIKQDDLVCPQCEKPALGGQTHQICRRKYTMDGLWSLGVYENPLRKIIQKLKYKYIKEAAGILTDITLEYWAKYQPFLLDEIKKSGGEDWVIVPVPLHWYRENKRGFNQASLIGKDLAERMGLKYIEALKRIRYTGQQVKLNEKDRRQNIKNAFILKSLILNPESNVILIDDVWTTGSTLKECCYVLKRGGAKKVWALTLAR
jgi:competence protein ComFC